MKQSTISMIFVTLLALLAAIGFISIMNKALEMFEGDAPVVCLEFNNNRQLIEVDCLYVQ